MREQPRYNEMKSGLMKSELFSRHRFALHRSRAETERREPGSFRRRCLGLRRRRQSGRNRHRSRQPKAGSARTRHKPHSAGSASQGMNSPLSRRSTAKADQPSTPRPVAERHSISGKNFKPASAGSVTPQLSSLPASSTYLIVQRKIR